MVMKASRQALTLIELLVVIAVIGVLATLLVPAVQQAREAVRQTQCKNNLRQIGLALATYHNNWGAFPLLLAHNSRVSPKTSFEEGWWSWNVRILPYVEQKPLYDQIEIDHDALWPFFQGLNKDQVSRQLSVLLCRSDPWSARNLSADYGFGPQALAHTNYQGCRGSTRTVPGDGVFPATNVSARMQGVTDGLSNTLQVGERPIDRTGVWGTWALGTGLDNHGLADHVLDCSERLHRGVSGSSDDLNHFWSLHPGGAYFLFCDGSTKFLNYSIDHVTFQEIGSRDGGESATFDGVAF
jgi:prepilin-type N-terminal cleavage/methylation domain-containing protein/prepilin-type processing-associated H-X9-DG protein